MKKVKTTIFLFLLLLPILAGAQGLVPCGGPGQSPCGLCDLFQLFVNVINFVLFTLVPPLAAVFFVIAGFNFYASGGDPSKVKKAQDILKSVIIGLVIIYSAHFAVSMVLNALNVVDVQWPDINVCN